MFDEAYLRKIFAEWFETFAKQHELKCFSWIDLYILVKAYIRQILDEKNEMTDEAAIDQLQRSGWMQRHDREMSFDSLTALVNNMMKNGDKSISVNVYPWKEDDV